VAIIDADRNIGLLLPKLTSQERNEVLFALKCFNCEKYWSFCLADLTFVKLDDARAAVRMWGSPALASKVENWRAK
jgi:hypothetical protein